MPIPDRALRPGTRLTATYKKKVYSAEVLAAQGGAIRFRLANGREFTSPSAAGKAVMAGTACNGWRFWSIAKIGAPTDTTRATTRADSAPQASPSPNGTTPTTAAKRAPTPAKAAKR